MPTGHKHLSINGSSASDCASACRSALTEWYQQSHSAVVTHIQPHGVLCFQVQNHPHGSYTGRNVVLRFQYNVLQANFHAQTLPQGQRYFCRFYPQLCFLQSWSRCTKHGFWKNVKPSTQAWCPRSFAFQPVGSLTSPPTLTSIALHLTNNINRYSSMQLQGLETV